jgi:hypothetical protein
LRRFKYGVLCYSADNLEAHLLGGFSESFSSKDVCRVCHCQYHQLENDICEAHGFWSVEEYDRICASMREEIEDEPEMAITPVEVNDANLFGEFPDDTDESFDSDTDSNEDVSDEEIDRRGLKSECPFNILQSFHSVTSFPLGKVSIQKNHIF